MLPSFSSLLLVLSFFDLWLLLSGSCEILLLMCGILSSIATALFAQTIWNHLDAKIELSPLGAIRYFIWLIREALISALVMLRNIWALDPKPDARFIKVPIQSAAYSSSAILMCSITFTPGTISTTFDEQHVVVSCYDGSIADDLLEGSMSKALIRAGASMVNTAHQLYR